MDLHVLTLVIVLAKINIFSPNILEHAVLESVLLEGTYKGSFARCNRENTSVY